MKVIVMRGRISNKSTCDVKRCKRKDRYLLFVPLYEGDCSTQLSRLRALSCSKHLTYLVDKLIKEELVRRE